MRNYLDKILFIIDYKYKNLIIFFLLFSCISFLEVVTLGIIGPYLTLLTSPEVFYKNLDIYFPNFSQSIIIDNLIIYFGIIVISIIILKSTIFILCQYFIAKFSWNEIVILRSKLTDKYKKISYEKYIKKNSSEYIQNVSVICANFVKATLMPLIQIICDSVLTISIIIFLMLTDIIVFLSVSFVLIFVGFILDKFFKKRLLLWGRLKNEAAVEVIKGVENSYLGYKETKILNKVSIFKKFILNASRALANIEIKLKVINLLPRASIEILAVTILIGFIFVYIIYQNYFLIDIIPKLVVFFLAALRIGPAIAGINVNINNLRVGKFAVDKLYEEFNEEITYSENNLEEKNTEEFSDFKSISLINISYKYPNTNDFVVKDINFKINKGEILGVTGPSGSGKTTCIDLILGLLYPTSGEIRINDKILSKYNSSSWYKKVAYLPQEIFIINESILRNITLSNNDDYDKDFLENILKKTNLESFIEKLPNGINTSVGERGVNLSGGQRQRIALARSLYQNRDIIVMDESTSSLDYEAEKRIINEVSQLKNKTTIILISHNFNILSVCDKIMYVNNGTVKKMDNFKQLFENEEKN